MIPPNKINPAVRSLKREHTCLNQEISRWREWWAELCEIGLPHFGEMGDRVAHLRDHLINHFKHEENESNLPLVTQLSSDDI